MTAEPAERRVRELRIAADHASYQGHFPGTPILPGAVLLDAVLHELESSPPFVHAPVDIRSCKFLGPVRPADPLSVEFTALADGSIRFTVRCEERTVAAGVLAAARRGASAL
ncbi:MAG TPA: hypothetical protein VMV25_12415 [Steroidobacteraceae bacterium]|nr:hypothetical protein [Steroidobacteraceae bacterium]